MTTAAERREHLRQRATLPLELEIEIHGFDGDDERFRARGQTINIGLGGLLARVDRDVEGGTRCLAHFPGSEGLVDRTMIYGLVKRATRVGEFYEVAVIFDNPLGELPDPSGPEHDGR